MAGHGPRQVVVLDAAQRSALAAIRSLGRQGLSVAAAAPWLPAIGSVSRYVSARHLSPDPAGGLAAARDWLDRLCVRGRDITLFPATDAMSLVVDAARAGFQQSVVMPPSAAYHRASDKAALVGLARELGIPVPATAICTSRGELVEAVSRHPMPFVVKPARSRVVVADRVESLAVRLVRSRVDAEAMAAAPWIDHTPALVQEFIPGHGAGVFTVFGPRGPLAWFAHRRLREKPPSGGVSVLSESVPVDGRLQDLSQRLLDALAWQGLAMVEFRIAEDGTPYLMEINARLWGSVQLAIDCGVDFPWLAYQVAIGESPPPVTGYAVGRRLRWLLGDADNLWLQWKDSQTSFVSKLAASGRFLGTFADLRARNEVFRWNDAAPGRLEFRQWLGGTP